MVHASPSFIQTLLETELEFSKKQIARGEFLDAAKWARKAIDLLDSDGESEQKKLAPTIAAPLRQAVLKTLATAYIYSEVPANLELAGNAIELAQEADPDDAGLYFLQQKKLLLEGAADETRMLQLCDMSVQKANLSNEGSVSM